MIYDIISYILIGALFIAMIIPLIALLRKTNKEQRDLDEVKTTKKDQPHKLKADYFSLSRLKSS
jgi:uncharacterized protein YoxC